MNAVFCSTAFLPRTAAVARLIGVRAYVYQCGPDHFSCKLETPAPALGLLVAIFDPAGRSIARLPAPVSVPAEEVRP